MSSAVEAHGLAGTAGSSKIIALRVRDPGDGNAGALLQVESTVGGAAITPTSGQPVVDQGLGVPVGATKDCTTSAQLFPGVTTPAYVMITNGGATAVTVGASPVVAGVGLSIPAGVGPVSWRAANPSLLYGIGNNAVVAAVLQ